MKIARSNGEGLIFVVLVFFSILALLWVFRIPVPTQSPNPWSHFNPDEWSHIAYIDYMAKYKTFPPFIPKYSAPSFQQPYYYLIVSPIYFLIKTLSNYIIAVYVLCIFSVFCGLGIIFLSYKTVRLITNKTNIALMTAFIVSSVPFFIPLSAAVGNEILSAFFATFTLYLLIKSYKLKLKESEIYLLFFITALSIGTKLTTIGLFPILILVLWILGRKFGISLRKRVKYIFFACGLQFIISGWWFALNKIYYGDALKTAVIDKIWGKIQPGFSEWSAKYSTSAFEYLYLVFRIGWYSFWGFFNALRQPFPKSIYIIISLFIFLGLFGFILKKKRVNPVILIIFIGYSVSVLLIYFSYNWIRFSPQGRYLFSSLLPFGFIIATGWTVFKPKWVNLISYSYIFLMVTINICSVIYFPGHINSVYMNPIFYIRMTYKVN